MIIHSERFCSYCGKKFVPTHGSQKYCTKFCAEEVQREKSRKAYRDKKREKTVTICQCCGKEFYGKNKNQKYCSRECAGTGEKQSHICWNCKNSVPNPKTGAGCSWSRKHTPVEGWTAQYDPKKYFGQMIETYFVTACPKFERG